jgi:hypothetical protein
VQADATGLISAHGVWVAGNVADVTGGVMQAASSGVIAAVAINADLTAEDTRAPWPLGAYNPPKRRPLQFEAMPILSGSPRLSSRTSMSEPSHAATCAERSVLMRWGMRQMVA